MTDEPPSTSPGLPTYEETILAIARDIDALKADFPQLESFSVDLHCQAHRLRIGYSHSTRRSQRAGGWRAAAPAPNPDGVWFVIELFDPDSPAQIHRQPVVEPLAFRDKKVLLLVLDGTETKPLAGHLRQILMERGVRVVRPR